MIPYLFAITLAEATQGLVHLISRVNIEFITRQRHNLTGQSILRAALAAAAGERPTGRGPAVVVALCTIQA